jgi:DNA-binding transcriptional MerR regulator
MSAQSVRKYEAWGFLPPADRSAGGHRRFTPRHLEAMRVARALIGGYGWEPARRVMAAVHRGDTAAALAAVDASHGALDRERQQLGQLLGALRAAAQPTSAPPGAPTAQVGIGEAARRAGVRASAVRFWEQQGVLRPARDRSSRYRRYDARQLRLLEVVALLRRAGYGFDVVRLVVDELRAGRPARAVRAAEQRVEELTEASRRRVKATAALAAYLGVADAASGS